MNLDKIVERYVIPLGLIGSLGLMSYAWYSHEQNGSEESKYEISLDDPIDVQAGFGGVGLILGIVMYSSLLLKRTKKIRTTRYNPSIDDSETIH